MRSFGARRASPPACTVDQRRVADEGLEASGRSARCRVTSPPRADGSPNGLKAGAVSAIGSATCRAASAESARRAPPADPSQPAQRRIDEQEAAGSHRPSRSRSAHARSGRRISRGRLRMYSSIWRWVVTISTPQEMWSPNLFSRLAKTSRISRRPSAWTGWRHRPAPRRARPARARSAQRGPCAGIEGAALQDHIERHPLVAELADEGAVGEFDVAGPVDDLAAAMGGIQAGFQQIAIRN